MAGDFYPARVLADGVRARGRVQIWVQISEWHLRFLWPGISAPRATCGRGFPIPRVSARKTVPKFVPGFGLNVTTEDYWRESGVRDFNGLLLEETWETPGRRF